MSIFILVILVRITDLLFHKSTQMTPTPASVNLSELKVAFYRGEHDEVLELLLLPPTVFLLKFLLL